MFHSPVGGNIINVSWLLLEHHAIIEVGKSWRIWWEHLKWTEMAWSLAGNLGTRFDERSLSMRMRRSLSLGREDLIIWYSGIALDCPVHTLGKAGKLVSCYWHTFFRDKKAEEKNPKPNQKTGLQNQNTVSVLYKKIIFPLVILDHFYCPLAVENAYGEIIKLGTIYVVG